MNFESVYCGSKLRPRCAADSVSRPITKCRTKDISFFVLLKIVIGSSEGQRRKFGAQTIDRLSWFILVAVWLCFCPITLHPPPKKRKENKRQKKREETTKDPPRYLRFFFTCRNRTMYVKTLRLSSGISWKTARAPSLSSNLLMHFSYRLVGMSGCNHFIQRTTDRRQH